MLSTEDRALARGVRESIEFMSEGRSPQPRRHLWTAAVLTAYAAVLGALALAIYVGTRIPGL